MMLTADWHLPYVSVPMLKGLLSVAKSGGVQVLAVVGDLYDLGSLSKFIEKQPDQRTLSVYDEKKIGREVVRLLERQFRRIWFIPGNHDMRALAKLAFAFPAQSLAGLLGLDPAIWRILDKPYADLTFSGRPAAHIRLTHPRTYRQMRLSTPRDLAARFRCDIVNTHGHHAGLSYSTGGYRIMELGIMADPCRVPWACGPDTNHPVWGQGFAWFRDGKLLPFMPGFCREL
jgi:hypothetical protein